MAKLRAAVNAVGCITTWGRATHERLDPSNFTSNTLQFLIRTEDDERPLTVGQTRTVLSCYLSYKYNSHSAQVASPEFIEQLAGKSVSLAGLQSAAAQLKRVTREAAKMKPTRETIFERLFNKSDAAAQLKELQKIYKYSFCEPYLRSVRLSKIQRIYFKFLKHLRNQYIKEKGRKHGEKGALECSYDVHNVRKYVRRRVVREDRRKTAIKDKVLRNLSVHVEQKPHNLCVSRGDLFAFRLSNDDLSDISDAEQQSDQLSDVNAARCMLDNEQQPNVRKPNFFMIRRSISKSGLLVGSTVSRLSKVTAGSSMLDSNNPLNVGASNHLTVDQAKAWYRIESINEDAHANAMDGEALDDKKIKLPLIPSQFSLYKKTELAISTNVGELPDSKRNPSLPPVGHQRTVVRSNKRKPCVLHKPEQCAAKLGSAIFSKRTSVLVETKRTEQLGNKEVRASSRQSVKKPKLDVLKLKNAFAGLPSRMRSIQM